MLFPWNSIYPSTTWRMADKDCVYFHTIVFRFKCWRREGFFLNVQKLVSSSLPWTQKSHQCLTGKQSSFIPHSVLQCSSEDSGRCSKQLKQCTSLCPYFLGSREQFYVAESCYSTVCAAACLPLFPLRHKLCLGEGQGLCYAAGPSHLPSCSLLVKKRVIVSLHPGAAQEW